MGKRNFTYVNCPLRQHNLGLSETFWAVISFTEKGKSGKCMPSSTAVLESTKNLFLSLHLEYYIGSSVLGRGRRLREHQIKLSGALMRT